MREARDVTSDPRYDYMVGRLIGAAEMLAFYNTIHGDEKSRGMARVMYNTLEFFFDSGKEIDPTKHVHVLPPSEQPTEVIRKP